MSLPFGPVTSLNEVSPKEMIQQKQRATSTMFFFFYSYL